MKIEAVDLFYLSMSQIADIGDGSQDALLVRVQAGEWTGWGECEASPLVSIANWACPMSHSACKPLSLSVLGQRLDEPSDIARISQIARANGLDIAQTDHTLSGIDIALWDLLGKNRGQPVYELLGYPRAYPRTPYASQLFGQTPQETLLKAQSCRAQGYEAAKFGWGPYGLGEAASDRDQVAAAREGLGRDALLLIDAGTVWGDDLEAARLRVRALQEQQVSYLEEPFTSGSLESYAALADLCAPVQLAAGEGAHNFAMARHLIDYGRVGLIQIDTGRIGGITTAKAVADYAAARDIPYINHTFTTHLALSASLQPYAGLQSSSLCEYPLEASTLATGLVSPRLLRNGAGQIELPAAPGLGVEPDPAVIRQYLVPVRIEVAGRTIYQSPDGSAL